MSRCVYDLANQILPFYCFQFSDHESKLFNMKITSRSEEASHVLYHVYNTDMGNYFD